MLQTCRPFLVFAIILLILPGLYAQPLPFQPVSGVAGKVSGDVRLVCQSNWHNFDIGLTCKGQVGLTASELKMFRPPANAKLDDGWTIKDRQLDPLIHLLHNLEWKPADADAASYNRWRGDGTNPIARQPAGTLSLSCSKNGAGYRLEFSGQIRVAEVRVHANRFGPNYQQDQWTHEILGALVLNGDGVPFGLEIRDSFEVAGKFHNPGADAVDQNRREGSVLVAMPVVALLSGDRVNEVRSLINQLGDDSFVVRERAMTELRKRSSSIGPYLRQFGLSHTDGEIRQRCEWLLRKLLEESP